jgi:hypothetical protein
MTTDSPPFDPPFLSCHRAEQETQYVETLADGKTRTITASEARWFEPAAITTSAPAPSNGQGKTYLNVPFAQKDEAKALGAKWDAAKKKWYVPPGVAVEQFERWM